MIDDCVRAVFYARVSTQEEQQLKALPKQIQENRDRIREKGWVLVDGYVDEGKSGTVIKRRDEYQRLLEDMELNKFDVVVVGYSGNTPHKAHTRAKRAGNTHINAIHNGTVVVRWVEES